MDLSTSLTTRQLESLADTFHGGFIRLFDGDRRASPNQAETGTLLGVVTVNAQANAGLHFTTVGGLLQKSDEVWSFQGLANGTASWFSLVTASDTGDNSLSAMRIDGSIGTPSAPSDMTWKIRSVVKDRFYTLDSFSYLLLPL